MASNEDVIQAVTEEVSVRVPGVLIKTDPPRDPITKFLASSLGHWFVDFDLDGHRVVLEFRPQFGWGITSSTDIGYGMQPDEVLGNQKAAVDRIVDLLKNRRRTKSS